MGAHLQSINFSSYQVLQMIAINLFGLFHAKRRLDKMAAGHEAEVARTTISEGEKTIDAAAGDAVDNDLNLSADEKKSYDVIMDLTCELFIAFMALF